MHELWPLPEPSGSRSVGLNSRSRPRLRLLPALPTVECPPRVCRARGCHQGAADLGFCPGCLVAYRVQARGAHARLTRLATRLGPEIDRSFPSWPPYFRRCLARNLAAELLWAQRTLEGGSCGWRPALIATFSDIAGV